MSRPKCQTCELYKSSRADVIKREIRRQGSTGAEAKERWEAFMRGVHERHTAIGRQVVRILVEAMGPS